MAVFLGVLVPKEMPESNYRQALTWLRAFIPVEKPVIRRPREVARIVFLKVKSPENPRINELPVIGSEVPNLRRMVFPGPDPDEPLPDPTPAPPPPFPEERKQFAVRIDLSGSAREPVTSNHRVENIQTDGFGLPSDPVVEA